MNFSCTECTQDSGTSLVCSTCLPQLSKSRKQTIMKTFHRIICERDGNKCALCDYEPQDGFDSGELVANHNPTQASAPDKVFDVTLHEAACFRCNAKHSYSAPKATRLKVETDRKKIKKSLCSKCRIRLALPSGRCPFC